MRKGPISKLISVFFRLIMRLSYNKNNHYPLGTEIGGGLRLPHNMGIVISGSAVIGNNCEILHQVTIGVDETGRAPRIGNNVFIGAGAKIIGDVKVGDNVKIGANAVVTKNVPDNVTAVGANKFITKKF